VDAGNIAADTESVVSKEGIHVHRMVADHTYSEDKQTWELLFGYASTQKRLKRVKNQLTVNCYQGRQERGEWENAEYTLNGSLRVWHGNECDERLDDGGCKQGAERLPQSLMN
jgi:hypothetical protein